MNKGETYEGEKKLVDEENFPNQFRVKKILTSTLSSPTHPPKSFSLSSTSPFKSGTFFQRGAACSEAFSQASFEDLLARDLNSLVFLSNNSLAFEIVSGDVNDLDEVNNEARSV